MDTLARHGLESTPRYILDIAPSLEAGERAMAGLLKPEDRPFCTNGTVAAGAMKAVIQAGLRIPENAAIAGLDGRQPHRGTGVDYGPH